MKAKKHLDVRIPLWWPGLPGNLRAWLPSRGNVLFVVIVLGALMWAQSAGAFPSLAPMAAPTTSTGTIAYQGRLADAGGAPLTGAYSMIFRIYNTSTGSVPLWTEQWTGPNSVQVSDGLFNVMLGSMTAISQTMITGNNNLWLGITVGTDDEMLPRVQLGSVPFAVQALTVPDGSVTTAKLASDVSLLPPAGSITTTMIADGAVTVPKLGEQPYPFHGSFATPSEWMADLIFNDNYSRFCQAIGRTYSRVEELQNHHANSQSGNGYFYSGWYYSGTRYLASDTHIYGDGNPDNPYNIWKYNGGAGCCIERAGLAYETTAIIWCK
jgi:hypothetical protein